MIVLVLNAGSSSLKFQLVRTDLNCIATHTDEKLARGTIERVGGEAVFTLRGRGDSVSRGTAPMRDLRAAVEYIVTWLASEESGRVIGAIGEIEAVGHRVVHGGERFQRSVRIDDSVLRGMGDMIDLAPLHNPHNIRGVAASRAVLGAELPNVAVFDTAFHHTIPEQAYLYRNSVPALPAPQDSTIRLPRDIAPLRRLSMARAHPRVSRGNPHHHAPPRQRLPACAIDNGDSVDTSMGFTPLEGLVAWERALEISTRRSWSFSVQRRAVADRGGQPVE